MNSIIKAICTFSLVLLLFVATTLQGQDVVKGNLSPRNAPYDQPLKGWAPYPIAGTIHQPYSMVFNNKSRKDLEPVEGEYKIGIPNWLLAKGVET